MAQPQLGKARPTPSALQRKINLGFAGALLLMAIISVVSYLSIHQFNIFRQWSDHTRDVLSDIATLRGDLKDIDSDTRGYLITGDDKTLVSLHQHADAAATLVSQLERDTHDNPIQQAHVAQLKSMVQQQRRLSEELAGTRRDQSFAAAQQRFASGADQQTFNAPHAVLDAMASEENTLLAQRTGAQQESGHLVIAVIAIGSLLAFVVVIVAGLVIRRDATQRKQAQEQLDSLFRLSLDMICIADFEGYFREVNPSWTQVFGFSREEMLGRPFMEFIHPDDIEATKEVVQSLAEGKDLLSFENRYRCKDGSYRWLTWKAVLEPDRKRIYATGRDVTDSKHIEEEMRKAQAQAIEANESKSRFLANMSHEIRTPMAAIIGYADLILDPNQTPSDRLEYTNTIRRNGEHLLTIINDVLDLSKIEAGKFQVERIECCPCQALSDVASSMRVRAAEKLIRLEVKNEGLVPAKIRTDPARLRQILFNLVGNAIKFTDEGWVRLIMRLEELPATPPRLRFDIIDTGIGMTRDQVGQLFQPFVQVDGSMTRRFGGTGLGLTISKRLGELLGGHIEVDSSPGRGSTFTVFIDPGSLDGVQRLKNCREALAGHSLNQPSDRPGLRLNGRVLLVDDGRDNRQLLSVYLRDAGAEVALAENGRIGANDALAAAANGEPFGVILMDMQMPELDGYGAASLLRRKGYTGPIVALTAHAFAEDRAKCLNAGCTDYLSKPVRRQDLLKMVWKYLNGGLDDSVDAIIPAASLANTPAEQTAQGANDDEVIRSHVSNFVAGLPEKIAALEASLARADLQQLESEVHGLKGSGGLFGFMPITDAAARVELLIRGQAQTDAIQVELGKLIEIIRGVDGFDRASNTPREKSSEQV